MVGALEGGSLLPRRGGADKASGGALTRALKFSRFTGKPGQMLEVLAPAGLKASRMLLVGLGKPAALDEKGLETWGPRSWAGLICVGRDRGQHRDRCSQGQQGQEGGARRASGFRGAAQKLCLQQVPHRNLDEYEKTLKTVRSSRTDPAAAKKAHARPGGGRRRHFPGARSGQRAAEYAVSGRIRAPRQGPLSKLGVKVEILGEAEMKKRGLGALLGVGQGSARESQLVVMQWNGAPKGKKKNAPPVALVGKGVCFDSGGLSLKAGAGMQGMKGDMGGAAAVTGTLLALATRKAKVNAVGVIGLVENMPDGGAFRPDDVLNSLSGQTIEVLNTDAEGRLVLADALTYTQRRFKPKLVIDLATLTGAIVQTLGTEHAGMFSNDDAAGAAHPGGGPQHRRAGVAPAAGPLL